MPPQDPPTPQQPQPNIQAAPTASVAEPLAAQPTDNPVGPTGSTEPAQVPAPPRKKRFPVWLKIIVGIVVVFAALMIALFILAGAVTKAPQKISDQFINDVQSANTAAAYSRTSVSFQKATTQEDLEQVITRISPLLQGEEKISGRALEKNSGSPKTAVFVYDVSTANGTKYIKIVLQEDDSGWKVVNFRSSDSILEAKVE